MSLINIIYDDIIHNNVALKQWNILMKYAVNVPESKYIRKLLLREKLLIKNVFEQLETGYLVTQY